MPVQITQRWTDTQKSRETHKKRFRHALEAIHHAGIFNSCVSFPVPPLAHSRGSFVLDHNSLFGILLHFQLLVKLSRKCISIFNNCKATGSHAYLSHPNSLVDFYLLFPQMLAPISELKCKLHQSYTHSRTHL